MSRTPAFAIEPVRRSYLHDDVARVVRTLIQSGELRPGERINEVALSDRFGISRTPLREAIKILATEGLLELLPTRGARVAVIAESEIEEVLQVVARLTAHARRSRHPRHPHQLRAWSLARDNPERAGPARLSDQLLGGCQPGDQPSVLETAP